MAKHAGRVLFEAVIDRLKKLETIQLVNNPFEDRAVAISSDDFPAIAVEPEDEPVEVRNMDGSILARNETRNLTLLITAIDTTREKVDLTRFEIERAIADGLVGTATYQSLERTSFDAASGARSRIYAAQLRYVFEYQTISNDPSIAAVAGQP